MPKVSLVSPFAKFHGKSTSEGAPGGQVVYSIGGANYSRNLVTPTNPDSAHQILIRSYINSAALAYQALSEANASAWRTAASGLTRTNILGQEYALTGMSLYMLVNVYRLMAGQAQVSTPPATTAPGAVTNIGSAAIAATDLTFQVTHGLTPATDFLYCRVSQDLGGDARQGRVSDLRTITDTFADSIVAAASSPQTVSLAMDYFTLTAGQNVAIQVLPLTDVYYPGTAYIAKNLLLS